MNKLLQPTLSGDSFSFSHRAKTPAWKCILVLLIGMKGFLAVAALYSGWKPQWVAAEALLLAALVLWQYEAGRKQPQQNVPGQSPSADGTQSMGVRLTFDPLTGLLTHRSSVVSLERAIRQSQRDNRECCVLLFDLDAFQNFNDTLCHADGDTVLKDMTALIQRCVPETGLMGRWGGDEFVVILPDTTREAALFAAEQIRHRVAGYSYLNNLITLTCSQGMASYPTDTSPRASLVKARADVISAAQTACRVAKQLGGNQVRATGDVWVKIRTTETELFQEEMTRRSIIEAVTHLAEAREQASAQKQGMSLGESKSKRVAEIACHLARTLKLDPATMYLVELVGLLHGIGKVAVSDSILCKKEPLEAAEWRELQKFALRGAEIVRQIPALQRTERGLRGLNERWEGNGFPDRLKGETIPLESRIVSVAYAYCEMTALANSDYHALLELERCAGTQFDPSIVSALAHVLRERTAPQSPSVEEGSPQ